MVRNIIISSRFLVSHRGHEANSKWCLKRTAANHTDKLHRGVIIVLKDTLTSPDSLMLPAYGTILQCKSLYRKSFSTIYPFYQGTRMCFGFAGELWTIQSSLQTQSLLLSRNIWGGLPSSQKWFAGDKTQPSCEISSKWNQHQKP